MVYSSCDNLYIIFTSFSLLPLIFAPLKSPNRWSPDSEKSHWPSGEACRPPHPVFWCVRFLSYPEDVKFWTDLLGRHLHHNHPKNSSTLWLWSISFLKNQQIKSLKYSGIFPTVEKSSGPVSTYCELMVHKLSLRWPEKCKRKKFLKDFIYLFLERGGGRGKQREETSICERNINWLLLVPQLGTWPTTQACALTGNWTGNILVCRMAPKPLSHTSQGTRGN